MEKYIAFLRGINVSGQKLIRMKDLKLLMESIGFMRVQTYIQSGNLVFCAPKSDSRQIAKRIAEVISVKYNFQVPVFVRTSGEMNTIAMNNPFLTGRLLQTNKLYVTLLSNIPADNITEVLEKSGLTSEFYSMKGEEIYLYLPEGSGKTKWTNTFFEKKLKVSATTRNWATINQLVTMAENTACS